MKVAPVLPSMTMIAIALASSACSSPSDSGKQASVATENPCGLHTQFAGDENCILAPDEKVGMQLHVGPPDYDNPDDQWVMPPGKEVGDQCFHLYAPNKEDIYYFKQQYRMRSGSHHVILLLSSDTTGPEQWNPCNGSNLAQAIGGSQHLVEDYPPGGKVAPEDEGLGRKIAAGAAFDVWLHTFNATTEPTLRELWINLLYIDAKDVKTNLGMLGGLSFMNVPPHSSATVGGSCDASSAIVDDTNNVRVVSLFGHAHTHTVRFAVENQHADGTSDLVYDSYERAEGPQYIYNSLVKNPVPDPTLQHTGATSGDLILHAGDSLKYTCDIVNDLNIALTFKEEVYTGEMCNLFGSVAGLGFPCSGIRLN